MKIARVNFLLKALPKEGGAKDGSIKIDVRSTRKLQITAQDHAGNVGAQTQPRVSRLF